MAKIPTGIDALPPKVRERLENPPEPGFGVHTWIFSTALAMTRFIDEPEAIELIEEWIPRPPTPANEIESQVTTAYKLAGTDQAGLARIKRRPGFPFDPKKASAVMELAKAGVNLAALCSLSPVDKPDGIESEKVLPVLFPDDPLVCIGQYCEKPYTMRLSEFHPRFLGSAQFIVPNPMTAEKGLTTLGWESARSETNVGPRRFAVIEADIKDDNIWWRPEITRANSLGLSVQDLGAALLLAVADETGADPTAVVFSGGVSLHGWFYVADWNSVRIENLYRVAGKWGCDPSTWTLHQWVRMPNGIRWNDQREPVAEQTLCFLNLNYAS